jgi:hypothetical protein
MVPVRAMAASVLLEEVLQIRESAPLWIDSATRRFGRLSRAGSGAEILTAIPAIPLRHALSAGFSAFVVGSWVMMHTVEADVQIRPAVRAILSKSDGFSGRERDLLCAGVTVHPANLQHPARICQ